MNDFSSQCYFGLGSKPVLINRQHDRPLSVAKRTYFLGVWNFDSQRIPVSPFWECNGRMAFLCAFPDDIQILLGQTFAKTLEI